MPKVLDQKTIWKVPLYPVGQKLRHNCSTLHRRGDNRIFVFCENSKIQNGAILSKKIFLGYSRVSRYPVGQKFQRNRSISHRSGVSKNFVFCSFCEKFKNSKWPPFWVRNFFLGYFRVSRYPLGQKFRRNRSISHR